ncbi:MAG: DUF4126 domain-containing protein [Micromonosporaceae bacterium]|nr:DUF4126 domain-containing protein [Micromonosporaceae bacterium]
MFEALTGMGLSASAGVNAYIPLLAIGLLDRYTGLIHLPPSWHWLANGWVLLILVVLELIEQIADKIPAVDSVNDLLHTVIRPTAGGLCFGAASESKTVTVSDPGTFFGSHQWVPVAAGVLIALCVHGTKAAARPVINVSTLGVGAPVASVIEDVFSVVTSLVAIVVPFLVIVVLALFIWFVVVVVRRRRRRRAQKRAARAAGQPAYLHPPR